MLKHLKERQPQRMGKQSGRPRFLWIWQSFSFMNNIHTNNHHYIKKFTSVENESFEQKEINMGQNRHGKRFKCPCGFYQIRVVVYLLGLGFSLWQTAVCLEKYFQYVRSTQVSMKKSTNTYLPALGMTLFAIVLLICTWNRSIFEFIILFYLLVICHSLF